MKKPAFSLLIAVLGFSLVFSYNDSRADYWPTSYNGVHNWMGYLDGSIDRAHILTTGSNVLVVNYAFVWNNGEGVSPEGRGSNWAWYGVKHGPLGRVHVVVYAPDRRTRLHHTYLHGPWYTGGNKYEWDDNEGVGYTNYGIYDWDWYDYDYVYVRIYESDPGWLREHDDLIVIRVDRSKSSAPLYYESYHVPYFEIQTVDLGGRDRLMKGVIETQRKIGEKRARQEWQSGMCQ